MGKCLGPEGASFTEERGSRELGCYLQLFLGPKKDPAWRISEGAHLVQENSAGGPSGARATPSTHGGGRRRSPLTPGPSGGPRARKALSGRVQPASGASEVWTPRGVCARERASSNRSGQVEATKIKSDLPAWRSTPPPPWFDPRPGRSEPRRVQPRLLAVARYCRGKGAIPTPLPPVATTWEPSSQGGARVTGEYGGGAAWPPARSVLVPRAGRGRRTGRSERAGLPRSSGERTWKLSRARERRMKAGSPGTPGHTRSGGRRGWPQEGGLRSGKRKPWSKGRGGTRAGKPIENDRKEREPGLDANRNCTKNSRLGEPSGAGERPRQERGSLSPARRSEARTWPE